ncbi:hypothetical protein NEIG_00547 [Nematocida sp. ERTm5]|nr:hypothetical protein NEIG_00547 [Nematocida sp. ERTm5]
MKPIRERWLSLLIPSNELTTDGIEKSNEIYQEYLKDVSVPKQISDLIHKDIERTKIVSITGISSNYLDKVRDQEKVRVVIERILTVFAYTNKSIGYVQGMNLICAIIYYVMSYNEQSYSESLCYFCFFNLMVDIGDYFTEKMDNAETGIFGQQRAILEILKQKDPLLHTHIEKKNLFKNSAFHIRWMILLFSAEFELKDTLILWERFFHESPKRKMIPYFCAASLVTLREIIINDDEMKTLGSLEVVRINPYNALTIAEEFLKSIPYSTLFHSSANPHLNRLSRKASRARHNKIAQ